MSRIVKQPVPEVRRVLDGPFDLSEFPCYGTRFEARRAQPYRVGDVIRVREGKEALVLYAMIERTRDNDTTSPLLPMLRVCERTATGKWSRLWRTVWPGEIERGFEAYRGKKNAL